jgi:hypothetical protein
MDILHVRRELSSLPRTVSRWRTRNVLEVLSGVSERPMMMPMTTPRRAQQRYNHRLRDLVTRRRGHDHRHGSRDPSLDGPWVAPQGKVGRGEPARHRPEMNRRQSCNHGTVATLLPRGAMSRVRDAQAASSPAPASVQWPSRRAASQKRSIEMGCGCGPLAVPRTDVQPFAHRQLLVPLRHPLANLRTSA